MSTNFYARIIPTENEKQELIDAINNDNPFLVRELSYKLYGHRDEYTGCGNVIHLGQRAAGWKFLWNPNVSKVYKPDICQYDWDYVYPLTKEGITNFVMREDVEITDEYNEVISAEDFLDMAFNWCADGLDGKEYYTNPKHDAPMYYNDYTEEMKWRELGYKPEYSDFYSDGLRFSTSVSFR